MKKLLALIVVVLAGLAGWRLYQTHSTTSDNVADNATALADGAQPDAEAIKRGRYVAIESDCAACHTAPGSIDALAGGYALQTPFGTIVSSNITPDRSSGIGSWTERQFFNAVRHGQSPHGLLYAAMPYNAYVKLSDQDMHDLWAYMHTVKPVQHAVVSDQLPLPFSLRLVNLGWNFMFLDNSPFKPQADQSAQWNRGFYLVQGPEHCAACHTPKNFLGGDQRSAYLQGGALQGWYAPEIAGNPHVGLGDWSRADIQDYLHTGSNQHSVASGPMAEAVQHSTQYLSDADLAAIATYLKSVPGSTAAAPVAVSADDPRMQRGKLLYNVNCMACHNVQGEGVQGMVTAFAHNPQIRAPLPDSLLNTVLNGGRAAISQSNPTGAGMPSFAWKLSDSDIADVLTYVRNSWGNAAAPVDAAQVKAARSAQASASYFGAP